MPLTAQIDALNLGEITTKIDGALKLLADVHPKIVVDGKEVSLSIDGATGLAPILDAVKQLPSDPKQLESAVTKMLGDLTALAAIPQFQLVGTVIEDFNQIRGTIDLAVRQAGGDPLAILDQLIGGGTGGLQQVLTDIAGRVGDLIPSKLPEAIRVPLEAIELLAGGTPADPAKLADVFARFVLGVDLGTLGAPSLAIDASLQIVGSLDVDLNALGARFTGLAAQIRAVIPQLQAPQPDVQAIAATLVQIRTAIDALFADLPAAIAGLGGQFDRIDTGALAARLTAAARAVVNLVPNVKSDLFGDIVAPLRGLGTFIDTLTAEQIAAMFDDLATRLRDAINAGGIGEVPQIIGQFEDFAIARLRAIGLARFRDEIVAALSGVEARIRSLNFTAPQLLSKPIAELRKKLDAIDLKPITDAIKSVEAKINGLIQNFDLGDLKTKVQAQFDAVKQIVDDAVAEVKKVDAELEKIAAQVDALDFQAAADQAREVMADIRKKVEDLLSQSDIGEAARSAISLAAAPLGQIDFKASVNAPIDAQLDKIDPAKLLAPLTVVVDKLKAVLDSVTPSSLVKKLDAPFNDAFALLEQYKPGALLAAATGEIQKLETTIDGLDPRALVAPLQKEFDKIVDAVRKAANPDPLFAPIEDAFGAINGVLDKVDLSKLLVGVVEKLSTMPQSVSHTLSAAANKGEAAIGDAVPPFKLGDLVRPFALLVQHMRTEVDKVPEAVIGGALTAVVAPLAAIRALLDGEAGMVARFVAALQQRTALLIPGSGNGPASDLMAALHELEITIEASAHLSAEAHVQLGGTAASMKLDTRITLIADAHAHLDDAAARFFARFTPPDLEADLRRAIDAVERFVPQEILTLSVDAPVKQRLDAFFAAIDPTPLADELDALTAAIEAKLTTLAQAIIKGIFRLLDAIFGVVEGVLPIGLIDRFDKFMKAVRDELLGLDPKPIKEEVHHLIDSVIAVLETFSPNALVGDLGGVFDDLKAKIKSVLDLFGPNAIDTTALDAKFDQLKQLQPSAVLAPLAGAGDDLEKALAALLDIKIGQSLVDAVIRLRAAIEAALDDLLAEFKELLDFLQSGGGASVSVSVGASV